MTRVEAAPLPGNNSYLALHGNVAYLPSNGRRRFRPGRTQMTVADHAYRFDIGRVFTRTFTIISRNAMVLSALAILLFGLPHLGAEIARETAQHFGGRWFFGSGTAGLYGLLSLIGYFALQAAVVHGAVAGLNGESTSLQACLRTAGRSLVTVIGIGVLTFIGVLLGMIALVVPGLMLLCAWFVATPAAIIEHTGVSEGFARSTELTRGFRWQIFALILIFFVGAALIGGVIEGVEHAVSWTVSFLPFDPPPLLSTLFDAAFALIATVAAVATYYELRAVKEDATPDELAAILD